MLTYCEPITLRRYARQLFRVVDLFITQPILYFEESHFNLPHFYLKVQNYMSPNFQSSTYMQNIIKNSIIKLMPYLPIFKLKLILADILASWSVGTLIGLSSSVVTSLHFICLLPT